MPIPELDLHLDGFEAADPQIESAFWITIGVCQDDLLPLAEHHSPSGADSFYVLHDGAATWGHPGDPQIVALHLQRDVTAQTFRFEAKTLPLASMAQSWLIHRGCPPNAIDLNPDLGPAPADEATRSLERRLMGDGDHFAYGHSYTSDDPNDWVTVVALRAMDERTPSPFRVVVEEVDSASWTHTLREGGFATVEAALRWCNERIAGTAGPLPPIRPEVSSTRPAAVPKGPAARPSGRSR
ncbi:hypothetical protein [Streptomyces sp. H39-C1]|uniref:hypothetical protein n=1 Tax=Streptomyces sp. H39-C1 TaxID=3004355 RepID=UPI003FA75650